MVATESLNRYLNIFLIVIDTLRYDYSQPIIDALKKWHFKYYYKAVACAPWTLPSHASMLTGLYPSLHGAHETIDGRRYPIRRKSMLITYALKRLGYKNILLTANLLLTPLLGFEGFDYIYERPHYPWVFRLKDQEDQYIRRLRLKERISVPRLILRLIMEKRAKLLSKYLLYYGLKKLKIYNHINKLYAFLKGSYREKGSKSILKELRRVLERWKRPLFVLINFMEVHEPYSLFEVLHPTYSFDQLMLYGRADDKIIRLWRQNYPKQVIYIRDRLNELLSILDEENILEQSLLIVTSDHGQLLGEHGGIINHIAFLYDELLRIPLMIRYPKLMNIHEYTPRDDMWIPNTVIRNLILEVIKTYVSNHVFNEKILYRKQVFAESFGIHSLRLSLCSQFKKCEFLKYSKRRIAIYKNNYKIVLNLTDNKIEEIKNYVNEEVSKKRVNELINDIKEFLSLCHRLKKINYQFT